MREGSGNGLVAVESILTGGNHLNGKVLMVHALGGTRGPARTIACLLPRVAESWQVDVAAPKGLVLSSATTVPSVRTCQLRLRKTRFASWLNGAKTIHEFADEGSGPDLIHANGLSALNLVAPIALRRRVLS